MCIKKNGCQCKVTDIQIPRKENMAIYKRDRQLKEIRREQRILKTIQERKICGKSHANSGIPKSKYLENLEVKLEYSKCRYYETLEIETMSKNKVLRKSKRMSENEVPRIS